MTTPQAARVRRLIRALRSGKFKKCKGRLRSFKGSRFCVSGVACELYSRSMRGTDGFWFRLSSHRVMEFQAGPQANSETMPHMVRQWFGMPAEFRNFIPAELVREWSLDPRMDVERVGLEQLNDGVEAGAGFSRAHAGLRFKQIANVLERWLSRQPVEN